MSKEKKEAEKRSVGREILSWVLYLGAAVVIATVIKTFLFQLIEVKGTSMLETLQNGDRLYVSILTSRLNGYDRGDIVICVYPGADHDCVKRVVAIPGDTVKVDHGVVYVNGEAQEENYLTYLAGYSTEEVTLGEGEYYVLGDNRPVSHDSHSADVGVVTEIVGEVRAVIWPPARIGSKLK